MIELDNLTFQEFLDNNKKCLIDFWAPWCGPCKAMLPLLQEVDEIPVGKVNVDINQELAIKYNVRSVPTLILFKNGKIADVITGAIDRLRLQKVISK